MRTHPILKAIFIILCLTSLNAAVDRRIAAADPSGSIPTPTQSNGGVVTRVSDPDDTDSDDGKDDDSNWMSSHDNRGSHRFRGGFVPYAVLIFILVLVLSRHYFRERTEQRRLDLLHKLVEKGQPVSETIVNQILGGQSQRIGRGFDRYGPLGYLRKGVVFTLIGSGFLVNFALTHANRHDKVFLILGIVFLSIGIGNLVALKVQARYQKSLPPDQK